MVREIPKSPSGSSAKWKMDQSVVPNNSSSRIANPGESNGLGDTPIKVTKAVKYKEYENDKRMTDDFATGSDNGNPTAGFDGAKSAQPQGAPSRTFITTEFSGR